MSTRAQILAEIAAQFPDNTTGLITPAKLRQVVEDVTNSCLVSDTDAGTAGIAVLQAETAAQGRAALGGDVISLTSAPAFTEVFKTGAAATSRQSGRTALVTGATPGGGVATQALSASDMLAPIGSREVQRNLDAPSVVSFVMLAASPATGTVFRAGYGKTGTDAIGAWATPGFGVTLDGFALYGFHFSTAHVLVDLGVNVEANVSLLVSIERTPTQLVWYINGIERARADVASLGFAAINSSFRYEVHNGETSSSIRVVCSNPIESLHSAAYVTGTQPQSSDLVGLTSVEVGGYKYKTIASPINYQSFRPSDHTQCRFYFIPKGDTSAVPADQAIAGIKLFGKDFDADQANYDDFGIYNAPKGLVFNSKRLGTGSVKSFIFCDQDTTDFVKVDVVTREVELLLAGKGIVMKSPDGTRYRLTIANGGALSATAV